ncbi:glycosyltransferase family 4 protein [Thermovirga sp.]|uniref:glycosyltransferase family 4 protein n=1 Tax=Thermovirga sp. TaxID=2699834 RepID=UPI0025F6236F|nr:glycosyltransferase family 4 protein [Thermovirga sp.]MBO8154594.1 glycosyltransferase family 4 protein [Thermovirga sp.]
MKILQAIDAGGWGGAENVVVQLSNGLAGRGHEVEVWARKVSVLCGELQEGIRVRNIPFLNDYDPFTIMMFKSALKNYDVVHVHLGRASILSGYATFFCRQNVHRLFCHMHSFHKPKHYRNQKQIICVSKSVEMYVKESMPWVERTWIVYNGINIKEARDAKPLICEESKKVRIGLLATFKNGKGHEDLLKAFSILAKDETVELVLGGDGPLLSSMKRLAESLGLSQRVKFLGFIRPQKAFSFWKSVDIACFPSYIEGCPISAIEAMAVGTPLVVYDYRGAKEVLGESSIIIPLGDVSALAHALNSLTKDSLLRAKYARLSEWKSKQYSQDTMINRILHIYEKAL